MPPARLHHNALGARFRAHGVRVEKVLSSEWCRCRDTATLMDLGAVETAPTFNNAFTLRDRVDQLTAGARTLLSAWRGAGTLVVVTHGANIRPLTGIDPGEGGMVVVSPDAAHPDALRVHGRIPVGR